MTNTQRKVKFALKFGTRKGSFPKKKSVFFGGFFNHQTTQTSVIQCFDILDNFRLHHHIMGNFKKLKAVIFNTRAVSFAVVF